MTMRSAANVPRSQRRSAAPGRASAPDELITVALPKGRLLEEASALFERALGVSPRELLHGTRRLAAQAPEVGLRFISIRAADVASYVEHGAAEVGVAGLDVLREEQRDLYEPLDLGIGRCAVVVAWPKGAPPLPKGVAPRVATKYVAIAARHFAERSLPAEIIELHGSIEVAPSLGLADAIVDITETGETLRANGLIEGARRLGPAHREPGRLEAPRGAASTAHRRPPLRRRREDGRNKLIPGRSYAYPENRTTLPATPQVPST